MEELVHDYPWSKVWRVGDCYRKLCGPSQRHEIALTLGLSERWADRVTEVVDHGEDWLLVHDAGSPVRAFGNVVEAFEAVLPLYAELQQGEAAHVAAHLAAGVPDQRVDTLLERFEEWPRFAGFQARFADCLEQLTLPPTVQHDDLHGGNVFAKEGVLRIIDWGDAVVGHPFTSLLVPLRVLDDGGDRLRAAYLSAWPVGTHHQFDAAYVVGAFTRIMSWQRIADATNDPKAHEGLQANIEWFLENIAGS